MQEAKYYKKLEEKKLVCTLCHHFCNLDDGEFGFCKVRQNKNGKLYTPIFGLPAIIEIDMIEKKPLYHFYPGTLSYSIGTLGCNFTCHNCHSWDISQVTNLEKQMKALNFLTPKRIVEEAIFNGCDSISYAYSEPTVFFEYALEIMKIAQREGLKNIWISNGFMSTECLDELLPFLDAINVDLKSKDDDFYHEICNGKLQAILDNLIKIKQEQVHLEISTLIVPRHSDDIRMLNQIAEFIAYDLDTDTPWHLNRFIPENSWKLAHLPKTGEDILYEVYENAKDAGLKYVYIGNVPGDQKENTYCPRCGELAIRRMGQHIERLDANGQCAFCDRSLDIIE